MQQDESGSVWIMVHSGSRNIGKQIGDKFNDVASKLNEKWHSYQRSIVPFLPVDSLEGEEYLAWMDCAGQFAYLSRKIMIDDVYRIIQHYFPDIRITTCEAIKQMGLSANSVQDGIINIHHNVASLEHHFGKNCWVHRKGATLAQTKTIGIIPGSMETKSFITKGLGNPFSLQSCSHGSGRVSGRKAFNVQNQNRVDDIKARLSAKGIIYSDFLKVKRGRDKGMIDISETGDAYKDVKSIMRLQDDLVQPVIELSPIISVKG